MSGHPRPRFTVEAVIGYSSLVGLIVTVLANVITIYKSKWETDFLYIAISLIFVILFSIGCIIYVIRRYDKLYTKMAITESDINQLRLQIETLESIQTDFKHQKKKMVNIVHNIAHEYRDIVHKLITDMEEEFANPEKVKTSFKMFNIFFVTNLKAVFDILTDDECSVCIKLLVKEDTVKTYFRDTVSYRVRSQVDKQMSTYKCWENTAFAKIMDKHHAKTFFLENNLKGLGDEYMNKNTQWNKFYNACLVVPIRVVVNKEDAGEDSNVLGFICVDNFKGNFDSTGLDLLASFGDLCFNLYYLYNLHAELEADAAATDVASSA